MSKRPPAITQWFVCLSTDHFLYSYLMQKWCFISRQWFCTNCSVYKAWQGERLKLLSVWVDEDHRVGAAVLLDQGVPETGGKGCSRCTTWGAPRTCWTCRLARLLVVGLWHTVARPKKKWFAGWETGLHNLWQPGSRAARKWTENEKMKRKWRENEERERDLLSTFPHFPLFFLPLYQKLSHFVAKC